ncbi:MAG: YtxH domain-containing protein [Nitrospiraceae bacterium]|nr:YtxH domain-containing protein [Nitrospiraceae bacterium]
MRDEGYSSGSVLLSFLLGGMVGAGLALLLAPQSGEETRKRIREFAEDTKEKAAGYVDKTKDKITSYVDDGKEFYEQKKSLVKSAIDAGKEAYEKEKERLSREENA